MRSRNGEREELHEHKTCCKIMDTQLGRRLLAGMLHSTASPALQGGSRATLFEYLGHVPDLINLRTRCRMRVYALFLSV